MHRGMKLSFSPQITTIDRDNNNEIEVVSIEINRKRVDRAYAGDRVAFQVNRIDMNIIKIGMVVGDLLNPRRAAKSIIANVSFLRKIY